MNSNNKDTDRKDTDKWGSKDFLKDPTLYITLLVSTLIAVIGNEEILRSVLVAAGSAMVGMSGALLGIVLAGLAIFIAFLDKKYIELINQLYGIGNELLPIKTVAILNIFCLAFGLVLIIIGKPPIIILRLVFGAALWNYFYLLWQMYELVKWLLEHAKSRAMQVQKEGDSQVK